LAAGFCPKSLALPENNGFARVWGAAAVQPHSPLAGTHMTLPYLPMRGIGLHGYSLAHA